MSKDIHYIKLTVRKLDRAAITWEEREAVEKKMIGCLEQHGFTLVGTEGLPRPSAVDD